MAKLTLSVDEHIIAGAKRYASEHGTSVSKIVEGYLETISQWPELRNLPPLTASLIGIAEGADPDDYKRWLFEKYK